VSDVVDHSGEPAAQALFVGVQLADRGKIYNYDPGTLVLEYGDRVVVGTDRGNTLGRVVIPPRPVVSESDAPTKRVVKRAEPRDLAREDSNVARARDALRICLHRIREREMPMKLVKAECAFEGSKIVFYFAAENRVDFRDLVRDLANTLSARIEMRQIGARDETKVVGGVGPCGR
jgi:cell fate regulator YaaT (PSP1 superfamily)